MDVLFPIVVNVIVPVFSLIVLGGFLHRKFHFDMNTLSKLTTYFLFPAVSFVNIYQSNMGGDIIGSIIGFLLLQSLCLMILSAGIAKMAGFDRGLSAAFKNSVVLNNSGNFGLPVSQLVFQNNPLGLSIQVVVVIFQNLLTYTYGIMNSVSVNANGTKALREFLKNPIFYALLLGLLCNALAITVPTFLWKPIENSANAFLAIALITLGAQSAYLKIKHFSLPLVLSLIGRLLLSPTVALLIILSLGLDGTLAQALLIASSFPTSRNSALFALEYNNHPEYAAQAVLLSTLCSSVTVTVVVYASKLLF
ncbi:AEC family transporter [Aneurinibacillus sp. REN35]|uniref:AEC family transporter n=1 Tax=Aneurinibacillus sp. REN35 TaxID=3237286 RepID=UPI003528FE8C